MNYFMMGFNFAMGFYAATLIVLLFSVIAFFIIVFTGTCWFIGKDGDEELRPFAE